MIDQDQIPLRETSSLEICFRSKFYAIVSPTDPMLTSRFIGIIFPRRIFRWSIPDARGKIPLPDRNKTRRRGFRLKAPGFFSLVSCDRNEAVSLSLSLPRKKIRPKKKSPGNAYVKLCRRARKSMPGPSPPPIWNMRYGIFLRFSFSRLSARISVGG